MLRRVSNSLHIYEGRRKTGQVTAVSLNEYCLTPDQTRYIPTKIDVKTFLEATFNRTYGIDEIKVGILQLIECRVGADEQQERNGRWVYIAPRELEDERVRFV